METPTLELERQSWSEISRKAKDLWRDQLTEADMDRIDDTKGDVEKLVMILQDCSGQTEEKIRRMLAA